MIKINGGLKTLKMKPTTIISSYKLYGLTTQRQLMSSISLKLSAGTFIVGDVHLFSRLSWQDSITILARHSIK
jgi:hypothetical protein